MNLNAMPHNKIAASQSFKGLLLAVALVVLTSGCASRDRAGDTTTRQNGLASYYGDRHHGRKTASGERFDQHALTAAHRTLPFGTRVRVTHLDNQREVTVRINDRGPFVKGRIIDLSYRAAEVLRMVEQGVAPVRVTVLD